MLDHPSSKEGELPTQKRTVFLLVKTWESVKDSGILTLTDLNSILLTTEDSYLRAEVAQRPTLGSKRVPKRLLCSFAELIRQECEILETSERIKCDLEKMPGYSVM